jgi:hypothetical protein
VVVAGEEEHGLVESDVIAGPLEDDALQVVVEDRPRHAAQRGERLDMATQERLQRLVEGEPGEHRPRP